MHIGKFEIKLHICKEILLYFTVMLCRDIWDIFLSPTDTNLADILVLVCVSVNK